MHPHSLQPHTSRVSNNHVGKGTEGGITNEAFAVCGKLETLELQDNELKTLPDNPFKGLTKLTLLNLVRYVTHL